MHLTWSRDGYPPLPHIQLSPLVLLLLLLTEWISISVNETEHLHQKWLWISHFAGGLALFLGGITTYSFGRGVWKVRVIHPGWSRDVHDTRLSCILWFLLAMWPCCCWHPLPFPSLDVWSTRVWCMKKRPLLQQSRIKLCFQDFSGLALFPSHYNAPANTSRAIFCTASRNTQKIQQKYRVSSVWPLGIRWHKFTS